MAKLNQLENVLSVKWEVALGFTVSVLRNPIEQLCKVKLNQLKNVLSVKWEVALGFTVSCPSYLGRLRSAVQLL